jgi:hypothetical protein
MNRKDDASQVHTALNPFKQINEDKNVSHHTKASESREAPGGHFGTRKDM